MKHMLSAESRISKSQHGPEIIEVISSFKALVCDDLGYASMPISSGRRWYENNCVTDERLLEANRSFGLAYARQLPKPLIVPALMRYKPHWSYDDYMGMWLTVVEECVDIGYMTPGWQYSNGCVEEFLWFTRNSIPALDQDLRPINIARGVGMIEQALDDINNLGFEAPILESVLAQW